RDQQRLDRRGSVLRVVWIPDHFDLARDEARPCVLPLLLRAARAPDRAALSRARRVGVGDSTSVGTRDAWAGRAAPRGQDMVLDAQRERPDRARRLVGDSVAHGPPLVALGRRTV